jgi:hypothetical protein
MIIKALSLFLLLSLFAPAYAADNAAVKDKQWLTYGQKLVKDGNYEKAIVAFEKAIYFNPENFYAFENSGDVYIQLGDKETALEYINRAYDLNPSPELKKKSEDLSEKVNGFSSLSFYPFTYEVFLEVNAALYYGDSAGFTGFSLGLGSGAYAMYHFNTWFGLKSGFMYLSNSVGDYKTSYLDIPVTAVIKFGEGKGFRNTIGAGIYLGPKISGTYGDTLFKDSDMPGVDGGLQLCYGTYYLFGKWGLVTNFTFQYSMVQIHPQIPVKAANLILSAGVVF